MVMGKDVYLAASLGVLIQAVSGWWDVFSHRIEFVEEDPLFNPAHIGLFAGTLIIMVAVLGRPTREKAPGLKALKILSATQMATIILNEIIHRVKPIEQVADFPVHSLFTISMLSVAIITFLTSCINYPSEKWGGRLTSIVFSGAALWMISSGSVLYIFHRNTIVLTALLGFIASIIILTAFTSTGITGLGSLIAVTYSSVIYVILVGYVGLEPYAALAPILVLIGEVGARFLNSASFIGAVVFMGLFYGTLVGIMYYPLVLDFGALTSIYGGAGGLTAGLTILLGDKIVRRLHNSY